MPLFRLISVLKLREQARDERRRELAQGYEAERVLRERSSAMQQEIDVLRDRTRKASSQGIVRVEDLLAARRYEMIVKSQIAEVESQIKQVLGEIEQRRAALVEADRDVKVIENLQQRRADEQSAS